MRLLRRRPILLSLTLLAIAMQGVLVLAHGHVHRHVPARAGNADLASRAVTFGACRPTGDQPCPAPARDEDERHCRACWLLGLSGAAILPPPAAVAVQEQPVAALDPVWVVAAAASVYTAAFQARGPPRV